MRTVPLPVSHGLLSNLSGYDSNSCPLSIIGGRYKKEETCLGFLFYFIFLTDRWKLSLSSVSLDRNVVILLVI